MREIPEHKGESEMFGSALRAQISAGRSNLEAAAVPLLWGVSRKRSLLEVRKPHPAGFVELEILEIRVARALATTC